MMCCPLQQRSNCTAVNVRKTCSRFWNGTYAGPDGSVSEPNKHRMFRHRTRQRRLRLLNGFWNGPPIITMGMGVEGVAASLASMHRDSARSERALRARERTKRAGPVCTSYAAPAALTERLVNRGVPEHATKPD
jgi:hypothetical protein